MPRMRNGAVEAAELRAEGLALVDAEGELSDKHLPAVGTEAHADHIALGAPGQTARPEQADGADDREGQGGHRPFLRAPAHQTCQNATAHCAGEPTESLLDRQDARGSYSGG